MRVVLIGAGRFGRSMRELLARAGVDVRLVGRGQAAPEADVYWLAVRDTALAEVASALPKDRVVLHASGVNGPGVLGHPRGGVLHPLMTFPGPELGLPDLRGVGARVDGPDDVRAIAATIARALGMVPVVCAEPVAWHLAASMVSGHLAALFLDAVSVLERAGVPDPASVLRPLAEESLRRAAESGNAAITGPAARGDEATVAAHLRWLAGDDAAYRALDARVRKRTR